MLDIPFIAMGCPEKVQRQRQETEVPNGSAQGHRLQHQNKEGRSSEWTPE